MNYDSVELVNKYYKKLTRHFNRSTKDTWTSKEIVERILDIQLEFLLDLFKSELGERRP